MITGHMTAQREATVRLVLLDRTQRPHDITVVLDIGFNGFLTRMRQFATSVLNHVSLQHDGHL